MKKLILILCFLFLAYTSYGADEVKNRIFVMSDFSGGIATKLSDHSMEPKYARIAENIRLNSSFKDLSKRGQLYTFGTADASEAITSMHRLYKSNSSKYLIVTHGDELEVADDSAGTFSTILNLTSGDYRWQWLTWHDLAIGGDGQNHPVKTDGADATYLGSCYAEDAGSGAGPNGTYTYKIAFYTASYTVIFNVASNSVTVTDNDISLSMIPIGPDTYDGEDVVGRKVYRIENGGTTYKLLTNGTIVNNTATTLTDSDADGALGADYPAGDATWTPPGCKYWIVHKNRLFGANTPNNPSRLYYSKDGSHDLFESAVDYVDVRKNDGDEITFIKNLLGILRVGKTNTIQSYYTTGDDPTTDWEVSDPLSVIGCDAPYSAVNTPIGILYLSKSKSGIYVFNGQSSYLKSEKVTPIVEDILDSNLGNVYGEYNDNLYYTTYASSSVGGSVDNRVLVYDILADAYTLDTLNMNCFCSLTGGSDGGIMYGGASDSGKVYQFSTTSKQLIHSRFTDFSGTFDDARYIPAIAGGNSNSPILELAWDVDIDNMVGTFNANAGIVNRPDTGGTYISPVLTLQNVSTYDKLYWNETLASGTDATFAIRSGTSAATCLVAAWSSEYTVSSGSDISALTANTYTQYRITMSTGSILVSPYVTTNGGFTTKLTYNTVGSPSETAVALHWQSGWLDFGIPMYQKTLRKIFVTLEGTSGTVRVNFTNEYGNIDYFDIDMSTYSHYYEEYFTGGALTGKIFKVDITNSDLNEVRIKEIALLYDVEPLI